MTSLLESTIRQSPTETQKQLLLRLGIHVGESLEALHAHGYVHSDVKTANVFVDGSDDSDAAMEAHLADFDCTKPAGSLSRIAGTFPPPESLRTLKANGQVALSPTIDAWAYGVLLYELFARKKEGVAKLAFSEGPKGIAEGRKSALAELLPNKIQSATSSGGCWP